MDNKENKKMHCKIETTDDIMKVLKIIGFVILGIAACFGFGLVVKLLWNWLMPQIFGLPLITYWQGIGLLILSCILLGRLGGGDSGSHKDKHHKHHKNSIKEKIKNEIRIEIEKDLKKRNPDYKENQDDSMSEENPEQKANSDYDELYEKWWEKEGEKSFEKYMSSIPEDE